MSVKPIVAMIRNNLWAVITGLLSVLWMFTITYAEAWGNQRWERKSYAETQAVIVAPLPIKVEKLETWQAEQKAAQAADSAQFIALREDLTVIKIKQAEGNALLSELIKSNDRVLRRLDNQVH